MIFRYVKNENGSAFIVTIMVFLVLSILSVTALSLAESESRHVYRSHSEAQAYYIAKSAADAVAASIFDNPNKTIDWFESNNQLDSGMVSFDGSDKQTFQVLLGKDGSDIVIESTGYAGPEQYTVTLRLQETDIDLESAIYLNSETIDFTGFTGWNGSIINPEVINPLNEGEIDEHEFNLNNYVEDILTNGEDYPDGFLECDLNFPSVGTFPFPECEYYFDGSVIEGAFSPDTLNAASLDYLATNDSRVTKTTTNTYTITLGGGDFTLQTKHINLDNISITVDHQDTDYDLEIYIDGSSTDVELSNVILDSDPNNTYIFYNSDPVNDDYNTDVGNFDIKGSSINCNLYIIADNFAISNNSVYNGELYFHGTDINSAMFFENRNASNMYVYSPNDPVEIANNANIYGVMVAKSLTMGNSATIHYDKSVTDNVIYTEQGNVKYIIGYYE